MPLSQPVSPFPEASSFVMGAGVNESPQVAQRMTERHKRIIDANLEYIRGKTILDLASHNGRWTYAALVAGAEFVLGIEGRQVLIDRGLSGFKDIDSRRFAFACGDVYDMHEIARATCGRETFDTILCLGIFYHITDHYRLIRLMRGFKPSAIIIDSSFLKTDELTVRFRHENSDDPSMAIQEESEDKTSLSGIASLGFLRAAADLSGYEIVRIPWKAGEITHRNVVEDYLDDPVKNARRFTLRLTRRTSTA